jgi:hypothetical protein
MGGAGMRVGSKALGLEVTWRYHFVGPGSSVSPARDAVFLDVGGRLCPGVIDQHQDGALARSTSELVLRHPELVHEHLLGRWLDRRDAGADLRGAKFEPRLVTHTEPDFDAMVSCWLVHRLVEEGELPPEAEALVGYSALVDQGEYRVDLTNPTTATDAVHVAYLALQNLGLGYSETVAQGLNLLDVVLTAIRTARGGHLRGLGVADLLPPALRPPAVRDQEAVKAVRSWRADPAFGRASALIDDDLARFQQDKKAATLSAVELPAADGGAPIRLSAFIAGGPTASVLNKYWVRADGFPYFICPIKELQGGVSSRVILSLDPTWKEPVSGRQPTLRGLGFRLEQAEAAARVGDPSLDRGMPPRHTDGSCDNADPWYDGRGHGHTIVDAPRSGSVLPFVDVCEVATSPFWEVRLREAEVFIAIPLDGMARPHGGATPAPCGEATRALRRWFADSFTTPATACRPMLPPPGMTVDGDELRTLPDPNCPPFRVLRLRRAPSAAPTLDALVRWLEARNREAAGRTYTVAHVQFEEGVGALDDPSRLLTRLCAASGTLREEDRDVVLYNGRAIALSERGATASGKNANLLLELLLYTAFQAETLQGYTARIVDALEPSGGESSEELRRQFLRFHAQYVHQDVVFDEDAREVYAGLREALGLAEQHAKAIGDLDRLAEIERAAAETRAEAEKERAERRTNALLFFVGLTGIVQAGTVAFGQVPAGQNAAVAAVVVVAIAAYAWLNWNASLNWKALLYWRKHG